MYPFSSELKCLHWQFFSLRYPQTVHIFVSIKDEKEDDLSEVLKFESLDIHLAFQMHPEIRDSYDFKTLKLLSCIKNPQKQNLSMTPTLKCHLGNK